MGSLAAWVLSVWPFVSAPQGLEVRPLSQAAGGPGTWLYLQNSPWVSRDRRWVWSQLTALSAHPDPLSSFPRAGPQRHTLPARLPQTVRSLGIPARNSWLLPNRLDLLQALAAREIVRGTA